MREITESQPRKAFSEEELQNAPLPQAESIPPLNIDPVPADLSVSTFERVLSELRGDSLNPYSLPTKITMNFSGLGDGRTNAVALLNAIAAVLLMFGVDWSPSETVMMIAGGVLSVISTAYMLFFAKSAKNQS